MSDLSEIEITWESHLEGTLFTSEIKFLGLHIKASIRHLPGNDAGEWRVNIYYDDQLRQGFWENDFREATSKAKSIILIEACSHRTILSIIHSHEWATRD